MQRRTRKAPIWRLWLLVALSGVALYFNQVVVPATPPLFVPTETPTESPESFINKAEEMYKSGKVSQAIQAYQDAIYSDPGNPSNYVALARLQVLVRGNRHLLFKHCSNTFLDVARHIGAKYGILN